MFGCIISHQGPSTALYTAQTNFSKVIWVHKFLFCTRLSMELEPPSLAGGGEERRSMWDKLQSPGLKVVQTLLLGAFVGKLISQLEIWLLQLQLELSICCLRAQRLSWSKAGERPSPKRSSFSPFPSNAAVPPLCQRQMMNSDGRKAVGHKFYVESQIIFLPVYNCRTLAQQSTNSSQPLNMCTAET